MGLCYQKGAQSAARQGWKSDAPVGNPTTILGMIDFSKFGVRQVECFDGGGDAQSRGTGI
eukprot:6194752-Pyramimonas_sp.AAC.1